MLTLIAAMTLATAPVDENQLLMRGYPEVRSALIADGWQPTPSKECAANHWMVKFFCEDFPEVQTCSPTGLMACHFIWHREGKALHVWTLGEDEQMLVDSVTAE